MAKVEISVSTPQLIGELDHFEIKSAVHECLQNINKATNVETIGDTAILYHVKLPTHSYYFLFNPLNQDEARVEYLVRYKSITFNSALLPTPAIRQVLVGVIYSKITNALFQTASRRIKDMTSGSIR